MSNSPRDSDYAPVIPYQSQAVSSNSYDPELPDPRPTVLVLDQLPEDCFICQEDFDEVFSGTQSNVVYVAPHLDPVTGIPIDALNHISQNKIAESDRFCRVESESPPRSNPQMIGASGRSPSPSPSPVPPQPTLDSTDSRPLSPLPRSPASRLYSRPSPSSSALRSTQSTALDKSPPRRFSPTPPSASYLPTVAVTRSPSPASKPPSPGSKPPSPDANPPSPAAKPPSPAAKPPSPAAKPPSPQVSRAPKASSKSTRSVSASQVRTVPTARAKRSASGTSAAPAKRTAAATTSAAPSKRSISATAPAPAKRSEAPTAPDAPRRTRSASRQEPKPSGSRKRGRAEEPAPPPSKRKRSKAEEPMPPPKSKAAKTQAKQAATTTGAQAKRSAKKQKTDENLPISQSKGQSTRRNKPIPATQGPDKPSAKRPMRRLRRRASFEPGNIPLPAGFSTFTRTRLAILIQCRAPGSSLEWFHIKNWF
ncbi:hypothetical protein PGT21_003571 [Puccinia graminis f. sp. tritici]|uniref:Uncharacterized protein n=1 Tax=Puccinia graminis f. sp. tritici TaxID=56615 RepID=A0A5B0MJX4_PUCGR|nr:hypothetical protein PGT21_003571 [Puccinia graminis f. sp. tritici]